MAYLFSVLGRQAAPPGHRALAAATVELLGVHAVNLGGWKFVVINNTRLRSPLREAGSTVNHAAGGLDLKLSGLFMEVFAGIETSFKQFKCPFGVYECG